MSNYSSIKQLIDEHSVGFIDFRAVDIGGRWRHVTVPAARFTPELTENGIAFDGSSYGYAAVEGSDMVLVPDLDSALLLFHQNRQILSIICNIHLAGSMKPFIGDPRRVANNAEQYLVKQGIAERVMMSPEFEFYVFSKASYGSTGTRSYYSLVPLNDNVEFSHYHVCPPEDQLFALRNKICERLEKQGISIKYHHHEVGPLGQSEIELGFDGLVKMADATLLIKSIVRQTSAELGLTATFMPKPIHGENGNGLHVHQYLATAGNSLFEDKGELSELGLCYIGGILSHGSSLMGLTNPSTNSYRRLVPGYEAPVSLAFGNSNRSAAIRIPAYASPNRRRVELRTADATCNPYFAYAAMLMAGVDGIKNDLNASSLGFGPYDKDLYELPQQQRDEIAQAPATLIEALAALRQDHSYLTAGGVFDEEQLFDWIELKKDEIDRISTYPHPREFSLYYSL